MKRWRDVGVETFEPALDGRTEEKMFRAVLEPGEAPAEFAGVAAVLRSASLAGRPDAAAPADRALQRRIVSSMVSIISSGLHAEPSVVVPPPSVRAEPRRGQVPFLPRLRLVAVAAAVFLFASMGLAFAGALPGAAQNLASSLLAHVGIHVPSDQPSSGQPSQNPGGAGKSNGPHPGGNPGNHGHHRGDGNGNGEHGRGNRGHHGDNGRHLGRDLPHGDNSNHGHTGNNGHHQSSGSGQGGGGGDGGGSLGHSSKVGGSHRNH